MGGFENPVVGGTALRIPAIQSPNYVSGSTGWIIKIDGSAEFNNLAIRGTFSGSDFIINSSGIFLYSGTPAAGNLIGAWAPVAGTDAYGNAYPQGLSIGNETTRQIVLKYTGTYSEVQFLANDGHENTTGVLREFIGNSGLANEYLGLHAIGPSVAGHTDTVTLQLNSQNLDGSSNANAGIYHSVSGALMTFDNTQVQATVPIVKGGTAWAAPVMGTGWATGPGVAGSYPPLQYHLDPLDNIHLFGTFHATSTTPSSAVASGFPTINTTTLGGVGVAGGLEKVNATSVVMPCYIDGGGTLRASSVPTVAVNDTFMVNVKIPRGNVA